ncbi:cytochrome P450 [Flavobacterium zepuense]|uniref:Cytochrome P450 n=1 Tax=Flavobacterium zepuense TaxID=2593302 RepID=A0A552VAS6_9FLAO|nr:cytochrome P450 [Flavobacterium zepuense]TRW27581.1 cytochrome P450 [Flavobacterium zepuense]
MDTTFGLFFQGYPHLLQKFRSQQRDVVETNILPFIKAIAMRGEKAAKLFFDEHKFLRQDSARAEQSTFSAAGIVPADESAFVSKDLALQVLTPESLSRLEAIFSERLNDCLDHWQTRNNITLFHEAEKVLCIAACEWLGIPLHEQEINLRTGQLSLLVEAEGSVGPRFFRGRTSRKRLEMWLSLLTEDLRGGRLKVAGNTVFQSVAFRKDENGVILDARAAGIELLNLIRPIVSVARHVVFAAMALKEHPQYSNILKETPAMYDNFVHEVRRYYPCSPMMAATVRNEFEYEGIKFNKGVLVMLDVYATNHHEDAWKNPEMFFPERFETIKNHTFSQAQPAGDTGVDYARTSGEVAVRLTKSALRFLNEQVQYSVPDQDLSIDMSRIPALPQSRFKLKIESKAAGLVAM